VPSFAVLSHGGRETGTSSGTLVVPPHVHIYFFTQDRQLLNSGAEILEDNLLTPHPRELAVRDVAVEVRTPWETIPNYEASGAAGGPFRYPTGVYRVGQDPAAGPVIPIPAGQSARLSDILGGRGGGPHGLHIYWLACRAAPTGFSELIEERRAEAHLLGVPLARSQNAGSELVSPSDVVARGGRWM